MGGRHELDDQAPVLYPLHGLVPGVHGQLLTDGLLDRDLTSLTDPAWHTY